MPSILLVDDESLIVESLTYSLTQEGFEVHSLADGNRVIAAVEEYHPDLVVLDIILPGTSGLEVCRRLREHSSIPVIMLTARGEEIDRILGLEFGADDYLAKPFSFRELLARIRAVLRRVELDRQEQERTSLSIGDLTLEIAPRRVFKGAHELKLSAREFELLATLMQEAGRAFSRQELQDRIWGAGWIGDPRTLAVHIRWLRMKIEDDPANPRYIKTVRGYGYRFARPEELV